MTSHPLVSVRRHGHVNLVKVEIKFHLECKLCFPCEQFLLRKIHGTNLSVSVEATYWVSWVSLDLQRTWRRRAIKIALDFVILYSDRWLKLEVTVRWKSVFPWRPPHKHKALAKRGHIVAATLCPAVLLVRGKTWQNVVARRADTRNFVSRTQNLCQPQMLRAWQNESTFGKHDHVSNVAATMGQHCWRDHVSQMCPRFAGHLHGR